MSKATHYGTCQACGRRQLLPGGVLAKHGYELSHGFMNGVCMGAGHLPYEQSCDLIERTIRNAVAVAAARREQADAQLAVPMGSLTCSRKVYHPELSSRTRGSVHLWEHGELQGADITTFEFVYDGGRKRERVRQGGQAASIAMAMRRDYAAALLRLAADQDAYADAQRRRIADWQPTDLTPRLAA